MGNPSMTKYVTFRSKLTGLWTVGFCGPDGWDPESDHTDEKAATERAAYLNGKSAPKPAKEADFLALLREVEIALSNSPQFNPWDLGPSRILVKVREAVARCKREQ